MRVDHELTISLLKACGISADDVREVTFHAAVGEVTTVDVTYFVKHATSVLGFDKRITFKQVDE